MRTKKYALEGTYAGEKRGEGHIYFALFRLCETREVGYRADLVQMMREEATR